MGGKLAMTTASGVVYISLYQDRPHKHPLYAVDEATGRLLWESTVWSEWVGVSHSGPTWTCELLTVRPSDELTVFGISGSLFFVESFDARTGVNLGRFCTAFVEYNL